MSATMGYLYDPHGRTISQDWPSGTIADTMLDCRDKVQSTQLTFAPGSGYANETLTVLHDQWLQPSGWDATVAPLAAEAVRTSPATLSQSWLTGALMGDLTTTHTHGAHGRLVSVSHDPVLGQQAGVTSRSRRP